MKQNSTKKLTTEEWVERIKKVRGDKYDYSKVEYKNSHTKVCIICPEHGEFWQEPCNHLNGADCPKCSKRYKINKEEFINLANKIHNNKYDYSKVEYKNTSSKVCIICPEHGEFWQRVNRHLIGDGCPKCKMKKHWDTRGRITNEMFIDKAIKVHGNKYDYSKVNYINNRTPICIVCSEHGEFWQKPNYHLLGEGCPKCRGSLLETNISALLYNNNINFIKEKTFEWLKFNNRNLFLDFYLPEYNIAIECQGIQHYIPIRYSIMKQEDADILYENRIIRDNIKKELCEKNNINLIYFTNKTIFKNWVKDKKNVYYNKNDIIKIIKNE